MWPVLGAIAVLALGGAWVCIYVGLMRSDIDERDGSIAILERQKESLELQVESLEGKLREGKARERLLKAESAERALSCSDVLGRMRDLLDQIDHGD